MSTVIVQKVLIMQFWARHVHTSALCLELWPNLCNRLGNATQYDQHHIVCRCGLRTESIYCSDVGTFAVDSPASSNYVFAAIVLARIRCGDRSGATKSQFASTTLLTKTLYVQ